MDLFVKRKAKIVVVYMVVILWIMHDQICIRLPPYLMYLPFSPIPVRNIIKFFKMCTCILWMMLMHVERYDEYMVELGPCPKVDIGVTLLPTNTLPPLDVIDN